MGEEVYKGEVTKAERIRELVQKGLAPEIIALRVGVKQSEIARALRKREARR